MQPIYATANTTPAFQLNWSASLFGKVDFPSPGGWLDELKAATEPDGVRILKFRTAQPNVGQFLVSTLSPLSPSDIIRSLKGRWQYLMRKQHPKAFRRNYYIGSIGEVNYEVLDNYVSQQTAKHPMADAGVQQRMEALQFHNPGVDLSLVSTGNYGQFVNSLQVVMENVDGWNEVRESVLSDSRGVIIRTAEKKKWRLSRIGLLSNHIHVLLAVGATESPESIALSLMNNLAYAQGMKPVFRFSYYVGTFGPYDRGVVRR